MAWRIGIDEAGYGPNLGPLVMSAVACHVPDEHGSANLWKVLRRAVRKAAGRGVAKLPVDDSKRIYSTARGLCDLERSVLSILQGAGVWQTPDASIALAETTSAMLRTLTELVGSLSTRHDLIDENWYRGDSGIPVITERDEIDRGAASFAAACEEAGVAWKLFRCVIVSPPRFNGMVDRWGSKGAVLAVSLAELLQAVLPLGGGEPMSIVVDKHGGRNHYQPLLQDAIPDGWVMPLEEGMELSVYEVRHLAAPVRITFLPRGDCGYFEVALASMISKYLRETLMAEFNRFWQEHIPGLEPTAGYPGDSRRFFTAIQPALTRLGLEVQQVWRER